MFKDDQESSSSLNMVSSQLFKTVRTITQSTMCIVPSNDIHVIMTVY